MDKKWHLAAIFKIKQLKKHFCMAKNNPMPIPASELILNPDGSIYHLHLQPEQLAHTVFLVGDPDRVPKVSRHFDRLDCQVQKREFVTHTGWIGSQRLSVISTGIGTDNIDIVLNELDALVNIDLATRTVRDSLSSLQLVRIGTSGSLSPAIPVDSMLCSAYGAGMDNLMQYYQADLSDQERLLQQQLYDFFRPWRIPVQPFAAAADAELSGRAGKGMARGITLTCPGFYAPQGRSLRARSVLDRSFFDAVSSFAFEGLQITNFEMETAAILGLARLLGHQAASCNAILANRITNEFSARPRQAEELLIRQVLENVGGEK
jgi:uridine phosphorylase